MPFIEQSWVGTVGIVMGYGLEGWGSIPGRGKIFLFTASRPTLGTIQPSIQWVPVAISLGVKRPECEADHSHLFSAKVMNGGAIPQLPHIYIYVFMS
jgi:hypothetical protein